MSQLLLGKRIRLALNAASYSAFADQLTGQAVKFPIADVRFEVGCFFGAVGSRDLELVDTSNWAALIMTFKAVSGGAAPAGAAATLMERTVLAADLDTSLDADSWADYSKQLAAFDFTEAEVNNIPAGNVWVVFTALLTNGKRVPVQFNTMQLVEDGYAGAGVDPVTAGTAYSKAEADALFMSIAPVGGAYRFKDDGAGELLFQLAHASSGKFHTVWIVGDDGAETLAIGPGEV